MMDAHTMDNERSQKLTLSTSCSGELKMHDDNLKGHMFHIFSRC